MSKFKTALVIHRPKRKQGFELFMSPLVDDVVTLYAMARSRGKINNDTNCVTVTLSPQDPDEAHLVNSYHLDVASPDVPAWFSFQIQKSVEKEMRKYVQSCIINAPITMLAGGQFILAPSVHAGMALDCQVICMMQGSAIHKVGGSAVVKDMYARSRITYLAEFARVVLMADDAAISDMHGCSVVEIMRDDARIESMHAHSMVLNMGGKAYIRNMYGHACVDYMRYEAKVGFMRDESYIHYMGGSAQVGRVFDHAQVGEMNDKSRISHLARQARSTDMRKLSVIETLGGESTVLSRSTRAKILNIEGKHARVIKP